MIDYVWSIQIYRSFLRNLLIEDVLTDCFHLLEGILLVQVMQENRERYERTPIPSLAT